jgi:quinol monooxygenase YgiN
MIAALRNTGRLTLEAYMGTFFSTTDWRLKESGHDAFVGRWTSWLTWTRETQPGLVWARLVADEADPLHLVSVGEWTDSDARQKWADDPLFVEFWLACLELCDDMQSHAFEVKVSI